MIPTSLSANLVIALLTPMLLTASGGDEDQARATAVETIEAYAPRNPADLLLAGEAVALGIGLLSSLGLSMTKDLPVNAVIRLRSNAASLHRAADQCRHALARPRAPAFDRETLQFGIERQKKPDIATNPNPGSLAVAANPFASPPDDIEAPVAMHADAEDRIAEATMMNVPGPVPADTVPLDTVPPDAETEPAPPLTEDEYYRAARIAALSERFAALSLNQPAFTRTNPPQAIPKSPFASTPPRR